MRAMTKVVVDGDRPVFELVTAAVRSAGLSTVEVMFAPRRPDLCRFPAVAGRWADLADVEPELGHADWRTEVLCMIDATGSGSVRPGRPEHIVTALRPAV
jgi:hypothetical protein